MLAPIDDPSIADFTNNLERINGLGDGSPGFVWRLQTDEGDATALRPYPDPMVIVNMTVWSSVAALKDFAYRTVHAEFLARRREWFVAGSTGVVLWWIRAGELPTVDDAKRRLEFLEGHGPSPYAFRFARAAGTVRHRADLARGSRHRRAHQPPERRADRTLRRPLGQSLPARSR